MSTAHFMVRKSALDKRWDAFYYEPEIVALEQRVQQKATHTLRDFVRFMSGGATPLKSESDQHYTDAANGVPFIRVQNLTSTGELDLQDVKHITHSTNNSSLARSRLSGGELLVKITGVGRMAVASVVPDGLEANINQHIAAIKTDSKLQSEALAAYLNLDFVERLATRRATGGTRPALDYNALLSIPIIDDPRIVSIMQVAYAEKKRLEAQAAEMLASIDGYLLQALGITLPPSSTKKLFFYTRANKISGGRFDALSHQTDIFSTFKAGKFSFVAIKEITCYLKTGFAAGKQDQDLEEVGVIQIRPTNVKEPDRNLTFDRNIYINASEIQTRPADLLLKNEILFNNTNSQELVGKTTLFNLDGDYFCSNHMTRLAVNEKVDSVYLTQILNLYQHLRVFYRMCVNWNNQSGVNTEMLRNIKIPLPPLETQTAIAAHISNLRAQAKLLQQQGQAELEAAKQAVGKLILGEAANVN